MAGAGVSSVKPGFAPSSGHRLVLLLAGCLLTFVCGGLVFGWAAVASGLLVADGAAGGPGIAQAEVHAAYVLASTAVMVAPVLVGPLLDRAGPRVCAALSAACVALGFALCGAGGRWLAAGMTLVGLGGPGVQTAAMHLTSFFPGHEAFVTAAVTGSFQLSAVMFEVFEQLWEHGAAGYRGLFLGYAALCCGCLAASAVVFKDALAPQLAEDRHSATVRRDTTLAQQLRSREFLHLLLLLSVASFWTNFYVGSAGTALEQRTALPEASRRRYLCGFTVILAAGAALGPLMGRFIDLAGFSRALALLLALGVLWGSLVVAATTVPVLLASFVAYAAFRSMLYNYFFARLSATLGLSNFGTLSGVAFGAAAACSLLQGAAFSWATGHCASTPATTDLGPCSGSRWGQVYLFQLASLLFLCGLPWLAGSSAAVGNGTDTTVSKGEQLAVEADSAPLHTPATTYMSTALAEQSPGASAAPALAG